MVKKEDDDKICVLFLCNLSMNSILGLLPFLLPTDTDCKLGIRLHKLTARLLY